MKGTTFFKGKQNCREALAKGKKHVGTLVGNALKRRVSLAVAAIALSFSATLASCDDDNGGYFPDGWTFYKAVVTVKPTDGGKSFFLQLDDSTTLNVQNAGSAPYGDKEVRAFASYALSEEQTDKSRLNVQLVSIDSILTKRMMPDKGEDNYAVYGRDWINVSDKWPTVCEDGYLTIAFSTFFYDKVHALNLVATNPDDPYELTFFHNANGDSEGRMGVGYVAFLLDQLPDTEGKTVDLTLKWMSPQGEESMKLKYKTRN